MFATHKKIIHITKTDLVGARVSLGHLPKIKDIYKASWNDGNLPSILKKVISKLSTDKVLLLLGQDLAYVLELDSPVGLAKVSKREAIYKIVQSQVPEIFDNDQWDYREIKSGSETNRVIAFVPVMATFKIISEAFHKIGCSVTAIEPEQVSKLRNSDPVLGIALKDDIAGTDENSLNLSLLSADIKPPHSVVPSSEYESSTNTSRSSPKIRKGFLASLLLVGLIGVLLITVIMSYRTSQPKTQELPTTVASPTVTGSPTTSIIVDQLMVEDYVVQVLNGSGVAGEADYIVGILSERGFVRITTGNADNYNYINTVVKTKESSRSAELYKEVANLLSDYTVELDDEYLQQNTMPDLQIIIGEKQ